MRVEEVIARLKLRASGLRSVEGAAQLTALMEANALPQAQGVSAFVLPTGLRGGQPSAATGQFVQPFEESVSILLSLRNADRTGDKALETIEPQISAVIAGLCGWGPDDAPGVFRLVRAGTVGLTKGTFTYVIEFSLTDQLRITP